MEVTDLSFAYSKGRPVIRALDLEAYEGEVAMILGLSGSGKTTLLKLCKGLLAPLSGTVRVLGEPVVTAPGRGRLDPRVAYIPQQLGLVRTVSALENVLMGALGRVTAPASVAGWLPEPEHRRARELLARLGIEAKAQEKVFALSGGERQRVAIARALMQDPRVLLADEFISDLDPVTTETIMAVVDEIARRGVTVVMTTHEMEVVRDYAGHVVVLRGGAKVMDVRTRPDLTQIVAAFR
jgi:phosphonate transport system ATP-binding protein